jgi:hypothetical protein
MSTDEPDDPSAREDHEPANTLSALDDEGLLAALRRMLDRYEPAPDWSADLAKASYALRAVDAELAALVSDSALTAAPSALRSGTAPRLAVFGGADLSVEIEIEPAGGAAGSAGSGSWRLVGQLSPAAPARIGVRRQHGEPVWVDADSRGRFAVDDLPRGPLSLVCVRDGVRPAVTEWISVG